MSTPEERIRLQKLASLLWQRMGCQWIPWERRQWALEAHRGVMRRLEAARGKGAAA